MCSTSRDTCRGGLQVKSGPAVTVNPERCTLRSSHILTHTQNRIVGHPTSPTISHYYIFRSGHIIRLWRYCRGSKNRRRKNIVYQNIELQIPALNQHVRACCTFASPSPHPVTTCSPTHPNSTPPCSLVSSASKLLYTFSVNPSTLPCFNAFGPSHDNLLAK